MLGDCSYQEGNKSPSDGSSVLSLNPDHESFLRFFLSFQAFFLNFVRFTLLQQAYNLPVALIRKLALVMNQIPEQLLQNPFHSLNNSNEGNNSCFDSR
jgi:hypothetical protein